MTTAIELRETALALRDRVDVLPLETPEQEQHAADICAAIKRCIADAEKERKRLVKPFKDRAKEIDAEYREPRKELEDIERRIKARIAEAVKARTLAAEAGQAKAVEAIGSGDVETANAALAAVPEQTKARGTIERWSWSYELQEIRHVPWRFLKLDEAKVREYLKTCEGEPRIPGVMFKREVTIGVRK